MGTQLFACGYLGDPTTEPLHELTAVAVPEAVEKFYAGTSIINLKIRLVSRGLVLRTLIEWGCYWRML